MHGKVLIIGSDEALCEELSESLGNEGYEVECSFSEIEGERIAASGRIGVILLDMDSRTFSNTAVLKHLKKNKIEVPVIIIMGKADPDLANIMDPADGCISKPFDTSLLIDMIERTILQKI